MNPRPPPTRPHIGVHSSFNTTNADWGEDDAWDSASDSESPRHSTIQASWARPSALASTSTSTFARTAPKAVPTTSRASSSSSTLAFSYTHLQAPSSYPPKESILPPDTTQGFNARNGWTIVRTSNSHSRNNSQVKLGRASSEQKTPDNDHVDGADSSSGYVDVEGDMILGDLEPETNAHETMNLPIHSHSKPKSGEVGLIRPDVDEIVIDPLNGIKNRRRSSSPVPVPTPMPAPPTASPTSSPKSVLENREKTEKLLRERSIRTNRRQKFVDCLSNQDVNIGELRKLAWAGIPSDLRPMAWQLLLGYLPLPMPLRSTTLTRKRSEYQNMVDLAFARGREGLEQQMWHQIEIDVPRTRPGVRLWMHEKTQRCLERILYVWAIRHPASGYVQGINDLVTPFFQVFLSAYIDSDPEHFDTSLLPEHVLSAVEADSFWCLSRLLDGIQDNYIFAQPGIQRSVRRMAELVARIDAPLAGHLESQNVEFMQFAFRWMNCLLMREISVRNTIRMWDTYLAEGPDAFSQFHLYVCSAFLVHWSEKLKKMDFQGIIMFLQSLPTQDWGDHEIEMLLSEAFVLNSIWHNAQSHFNGK